MQFKVPQFLEVEDKVAGVLTFKQLVYVAGSAAMIFLGVSFLGLVWGILATSPFVLLGVLLGFVKYNGRPFIFIIESGFYYYISKKFYSWHRGGGEEDVNEVLIQKLKAPKKFDNRKVGSIKFTNMTTQLDTDIVDDK
ncbi:MAG: PrgI family protein [Candidatus Campbellbacteria bacterium]|nr:PrgI family protein [Candidatus Campbellbacteria bacterium]